MSVVGSPAGGAEWAAVALSDPTTTVAMAAINASSR